MYPYGYSGRQRVNFQFLDKSAKSANNLRGYNIKNKRRKPLRKLTVNLRRRTHET